MIALAIESVVETTLVIVGLDVEFFRDRLMVGVDDFDGVDDGMFVTGVGTGGDVA